MYDFLYVKKTRHVSCTTTRYVTHQDRRQFLVTRTTRVRVWTWKPLLQLPRLLLPPLLLPMMLTMLLRAAKVAGPEPWFNPRHDAADSRHSHRSSPNFRGRSSSCPWARDCPADSKRKGDPNLVRQHYHRLTSWPVARLTAAPMDQHLFRDDAASPFRH